jgi:hypothetical protein
LIGNVLNEEIPKAYDNKGAGSIWAVTHHGFNLYEFDTLNVLCDVQKEKFVLRGFRKDKSL